MPLLASPVYSGNIRKSTMVRFGGYNHTRSASEGEIYDMKNMSALEYPILQVRGVRYGGYYMMTEDTSRKYAYFQHNGLAMYAEVNQYGDSFATIGRYVIQMPGRRIYDFESENYSRSRPMDTLRVPYDGVTISDGTYAGVAAKRNMLSYKSTDTPFRVGDGVTISGFGEGYEENNKIAVIEEINYTEDSVQLIFLENTFTLPEGQSSYSTTGITIAREVPEMDFICAHDNRLWGCKGNTIYCSKLGDPLVWNNFSGDSGCFSLEVQSGGDFTGCTSYLGYVIFFKEDMIYKVYGSRPSNYQVISSASLGVKKGSERSFGVAGEVLFYHSRVGIVAYSGGIPQNISAAFGRETYKNAVGGSDGVRYYVSMQNSRGEYSFFVYDTEKKLWMKEDDLAVRRFNYDGVLYFSDISGRVWQTALGENQNHNEENGPIESMVEFGDFYMGSPNKKGVSKIQMRAEIEAGAALSVYISFDGGKYREIAKMQPAEKRSYNLPIIPQRCDHFRIKLCGEGMWRLYSLSKEYYSGSEI